MKKKELLYFIIFFFITTLVLLEVTLRLLTSEKVEGYEYLLGKPWRYVLPFSPQFNYYDTTKVGRYRAYDATLGWDIGYNGQEPPLYFSNKVGLRCSESDFQSKNDTLLRHYDLICIGDSFTHGDAVSFEETWPSIIGSLRSKNVLNLGVGGYGIDQATLKLQKFFALGITGDTVLLGLISGDLERSLSTIYNFYNGGLKTKPKFKFTTSGVEILNQPCAVNEKLIFEYKNYKSSDIFANVPGFSPNVFEKSFLDNMYIYRIVRSTVHQRQNSHEPVYRTDDERLKYCINIIKYLKNLCERNDSHLIVLLLGNNNTFGDRKYYNNPWSLIESKLSAEEIDYFNAANHQYEKYTEGKHLIIHPEEGVHYSAQGNEILARLLIEKLKL